MAATARGQHNQYRPLHEILQSAFGWSGEHLHRFLIHGAAYGIPHSGEAAASQDPDLKALWEEISQRRATNMRLLAQDLSTTGRLRPGLSVSTAADVIWSMNSPEFYSLLVEQRGWSPEAFERWLAEAWIRLLLKG